MYISELGEVSPFSWLLLACFVALNYLRVAVIDPSARGPSCSNVPKSSYDDPEKESTDSIHRMLSALVDGKSSIACTTYILLYAYICAVLLSCLAIIIFIKATNYVDRIILYSLAVDKIETKGRFAYEESLILMIRKDSMVNTNIMGDFEENKSEEDDTRNLEQILYDAAKSSKHHMEKRKSLRTSSKEPKTTQKSFKDLRRVSVSVLSNILGNSDKKFQTFSGRLRSYLQISPISDRTDENVKDETAPLEYYTRYFLQQMLCFLVIEVLIHSEKFIFFHTYFLLKSIM